MSTAAKTIASTETAKASKTFSAAQGIKSRKATSGSRSPQEELQRRRWGVETRAVRRVHARKF